MLQTPEVAAARIQAWFRKHPSVAQTDANIACLTKYIADHFSVAGECLIDEVYLDLSYQTLGAKLQHIAGPEVQAEIQQAQQHAARLAADKRRLEEQAAAEQRRKENIARLDSQGLRGNHGFATADDIEKENARIQREANERRKAATRMQRHEQFISGLTAANNHLETNFNGIMWGKTNDARKQMKDKLRKAYPEFASEVRD